MTTSIDEVEAFRRGKDAVFRSDPASPIPQDRRRAFAGLSYYAVVRELRFRSPLRPHPDRHPFGMATTTGNVQMYTRAGWFRFRIEAAAFEVIVYRSLGAPDLFLPFRDETSGVETHGGGRYLDIASPGTNGEIVVDFNYAYHPYCAYDEGWSCPLPPAENWLPVPIRAGERL